MGAGVPTLPRGSRVDTRPRWGLGEGSHTVEMVLSCTAHVAGAPEHPETGAGTGSASASDPLSPVTAQHTHEFITSRIQVPKGKHGQGCWGWRWPGKELDPVLGSRLSRNSGAGRGKRRLERLQDQQL